MSDIDNPGGDAPEEMRQEGEGQQDQQQRGQAEAPADPKAPEEEAPATGAPDIRMIFSSLGGDPFFESLFGNRRRGSVNEANVHGSVLAQTRRMVEDYMQPDLITMQTPDDIEVVVEVSKEGVRVLNPSEFDAYRIAPRFRSGTAAMLSLDSFIAHVNRFGDSDTAVFADNDRAKASLTAVLDYHRTGSGGAPRFGRHRTTFLFPMADEWTAWNALNGKPMKMVDFARFLDDHIIDVLPAQSVSLDDETQGYLAALGNRAIIADPSRLMDLASGLQINEQSVLKEVNNLQDGTGALVFEAVHTDQAGQKLVVPGLFVLGIPVFRGGERYQVVARLRYRKTGEGIAFWYDLWRLDRVFDHAFNEAVERVQSETDSPVFIGKDEGKVGS